MTTGRPRVGVSACLLGERVRWNGAHKRDAVVCDVLGEVVELVPVCPEVEAGFGVPRPAMDLVGDPVSPRLITSGGDDVTTRMAKYADLRLRELERLGLDGYVLKSRSPSCGLTDALVHRRPPRARDHVVSGVDAPGDTVRGRGLFAGALLRHLPDLAVLDETQLGDPAMRAKFLDRVSRAAEWRARRMTCTAAPE